MCVTRDACPRHAHGARVPPPLTASCVCAGAQEGVANKKKQAQAEGHKMAAKLGIGMWIAVQARERWSTSENIHFRPGRPLEVHPRQARG